MEEKQSKKEDNNWSKVSILQFSSLKMEDSKTPSKIE